MAQSYKNKRQLVKPPAAIMRQKKISTGSGSGQIALTFPHDLGTHMFVMNFTKYEFSGEAIQNKILTSSIALPVPQRLLDSQGIEYNQNAELGVIGGTLLKGAGEVSDTYKRHGGGPLTQANLGAMFKDMASQAGTALSNMDAKQAGYAAGRLAVEQLSGVAGIDNPGALADLVRGNVFNPNIALLFQAVPLKQFSFNWRLAPQTEEESRTLAEIIRKLKHFSLPQYSGLAKDGSGSVFLDYPHVVDCFFTGSELDSLFFFKRAAITSIETNYAPEGLSFFAKTGAPTVVDFAIQMTETEIHTSEDYAEES